jgi:hypothetical protein
MDDGFPPFSPFLYGGFYLAILRLKRLDKRRKTVKNRD